MGVIAWFESSCRVSCSGCGLIFLYMYCIVVGAIEFKGVSRGVV